MAKELHQPVWSLEVPGVSFAELQGQRVAPTTTPFRDGHLPYFSLVALDTESAEPFKAETESTRLIRVAPAHRRSFEVRNARVLWSDEYGNIFLIHTTKGNDLTNPGVVKREIEPSGFAVQGMQSTDSLVRMIKASELLRKQGADTECLVRIIEPQELPYMDGKVLLDEFKNNLVQQIAKPTNLIQSASSGFGQTPSISDIPKFSQHLDESTLVITVRGMQVEERLDDLNKADDEESFKQLMVNVFNYANLAEAQRSKKTGTPFKPFDASSAADYGRYFGEYLPTRIATNYAKLHSLGLLHHFSHQGNISSVGSIYDLDSVRGESLEIGDDKVTLDERKVEYEKVMRETVGTIRDLVGKFKIVGGNSNVIKNFTENFQIAYFAEGDILEILPQAYQFYQGFSPFRGENTFDKFYQRFIEAIGDEFHSSLKIEDLARDFVEKHDRRAITEHIESGMKVATGDDIEDVVNTVIKDIEDFPIDRFHQYITDRLGQEIFEWKEANHKDKFSKLSADNPDLTDLTTEIFQTKEGERLRGQISPEMKESVEEAGDKTYEELKTYYEQNAKDVYKRFVESKDPEFDSVGKLHIVQEAFEYFDDADTNPETWEFLNLYLETLTEKTGLTHFHPESIEDMMRTYMIDTALRARMLLPHMIDLKKENESFPDLIDATLGEAYLSAYPESGIGLYIKNRIYETMREYYKKTAEPIDKRYGAGHAGLLMQVFATREGLRIEKTMTEEQIAELNIQAKELDQKLRAEFTEKLNG